MLWVLGNSTSLGYDKSWECDYTLVFFSSILSQMILETLSVSCHTCTSHTDSLCHCSGLRTDIPMSFKAAARLSGVPAAHSVPACVVRATLLLGTVAIQSATLMGKSSDSLQSFKLAAFFVA